MISILSTAICLSTPGQTPPAKESLQNENKGLPPRATPTDYQAQGKTGKLTIGAEFAGHSIPTPGGTLTTEDYVVVETGLFGPPDTSVKMATEDFSLRINGKKTALPSQPYGLVISSVKDPEWEPPEKQESKSKTKLGGGGQGESGPPPPVHIPIEIQRAMALKVRKAALPEGDRTLPQAGLLFFQYRGKVQHIQSIELIYNGPEGTTTINLHP